MGSFILIVFIALAIWLLRRDKAARDGVSGAIWIPTLWIGILCSRPVSAWFGIGGGIDTLDGSPADRMFFLSMIVAALVVLARRRVVWSEAFIKNWSILLFYAYLLVSVTWANSSESSFKRWFKEFGNIAIVLVLLTEANPLQAVRAVFVRCAYVLIPLSVIFIRYFPALGRNYNMHSGAMEATGVTFQKNSLGAMLLVCGLVLFWDWLERGRAGRAPRSRWDRFAPPVVLGIAVYLLVLCDSKTSLLCLIIGCAILCALRVPFLYKRIRTLGLRMMFGVLVLVLLDWMFGVSSYLVASLGRDMTFTGRTDVWRELLATNTDPLTGTGFMSFWDDMRYREMLPKWVAFSAHNGYLEIYIAGGIIGVSLLGLMLLVTAVRINISLASGDEYAVVRFAAFIATLVANFSESNFACMTPVGFLFLLAAIGRVRTVPDPQSYRAADSYADLYPQTPAFRA